MELLFGPNKLQKQIYEKDEQIEIEEVVEKQENSYENSLVPLQENRLLWEWKNDKIQKYFSFMLIFQPYIDMSEIFYQFYNITGIDILYSNDSFAQQVILYNEIFETSENFWYSQILQNNIRRISLQKSNFDYYYKKCVACKKIKDIWEFCYDDNTEDGISECCFDCANNICKECGKVISTFRNTFYCETCRKEHQKFGRYKKAGWPDPKSKIQFDKLDKTEKYHTYIWFNLNIKRKYSIPDFIKKEKIYAVNFNENFIENDMFLFEPKYIGKTYIHTHDYNQRDLNFDRDNHNNKDLSKWLHSNPNIGVIRLQPKELSEKQAFKLENKLINFYGRYDLEEGPLLNHTYGFDGVSMSPPGKFVLLNIVTKRLCCINTDLRDDIDVLVVLVDYYYDEKRKRNIWDKFDKSLNWFCKRAKLNQGNMSSMVNGRLNGTGNWKGWTWKRWCNLDQSLKLELIEQSKDAPEISFKKRGPGRPPKNIDFRTQRMKTKTSKKSKKRKIGLMIYLDQMNCKLQYGNHELSPYTTNPFDK